MSVLIKNLGAGTLSGTTAATPGPLAGKTWVVKSIVITNRDSVARALEVKLTGGNSITGATGTTGWIAPSGMVVPPATTVVLDDEITLQNPQALSIASLTSTTLVDVVLSGLERDV